MLGSALGTHGGALGAQPARSRRYSGSKYCSLHFFVRGINTTSFHVVFLIEGHFYMHKIIYSMLRTAPNRIPIFTPPGSGLRSTELHIGLGLGGVMTPRGG